MQRFLLNEDQNHATQNHRLPLCGRGPDRPDDGLAIRSTRRRQVRLQGQGDGQGEQVGADGNQKISITLEIEKGWYIYANPVGDEDFENNKTRVTLKAKDKVEFNVTYPPGKVKVEDKIKLNIYEEKVVIETTVQRTAGDTSPLQISIDVNSCNKGTCLLPGTVKLTVP